MSLQKNEKIGANVVKLEILVDEKIFKNACYSVYRKECKRIRVPGFRLGKAPKKVIEKVYGKGIFYEDAINLVYRKDLDDAIEKLKLDVVGIDDFKVIYASEEKGLCYSVNCILKPEVEVKNYKGIEVKKFVREITEKDVNDRIMALRERVARIVNVQEKRACKKGDLVYLDFMGFVDGISFKGGTAKNYELKLGSKQFIEGFEEKVIGHKVNEEFDVEVVFPKDYHVASLQNKKALFRCKLNEIKKIELPEEDDEFAKDVSEFDSLKKLRENIKENIKKSDELAFERSMESRILSEIVSNVSGDIPDVMFKDEYEELLDNFKRNLKHKGLNLEKYLFDAGVEEEDLQRDLFMQARFQVKLNLGLEAIAKVEKLQVSEKDVEQELEKFAKQYNMELKNIKNIFPEKIIKKDVLRRKTIDFVKKNAKIVEEPLKV